MKYLISPQLPYINEILIMEHPSDLCVDLSNQQTFEKYLLDKLEEFKNKSKSELQDYMSERCGTGIKPHVYFEMICECFGLVDFQLNPKNNHHYVIKTVDDLVFELHRHAR
jgi:hypothetical protein